MVSRENRIVLAFVTAAIALFFGLAAFTDVDSTVLLGVVLLVGVIAPLLINEYLDQATQA